MKGNEMPKFNLYPSPNPGEEHARCRVELGWQNGYGAQIATTALHPDAKPTDEFVSTHPGADPVRAWEGQFVNLTRNDINQLIRQLREVRDKTFGRDE